MAASPLTLLLLLLSLFASPALAAITVTRLPGFPGPLPFHLETGYETVEETNGVELFYYFLKSERSPGEDPVILWLTGGPGCSAFSGLVFEIGPLKFVKARYDGNIPSLEYNSYSWTKVANIIFLDSPVGSGFSFSRNPNGYVVDDITLSRQVHEFLRKWFTHHPEFISNPLYIAGDSWAGKFVPILANEVVQGIEAGYNPSLNLKGYLIGNPSTGEVVDMNSRVPYAHGIGIISDQLYEAIQTHCKGEDYQNPNPQNLLCASFLNEFEMIKAEINPAYTLDPQCPLVSPRRNLANGGRSIQERFSEILMPPVVPDFKCRSYFYYLSYYWANDKNTRHALQIKKGTVEEWVRCNHSLAFIDNVPSTVIYHLNLTKKGYRALVYSGDKDMLIPFIGTQEWIRYLNYPIVSPWRSWHVDGQVAGYVTVYSNNLTFTTIKDAGHTAPEYMPKNCLHMVEKWFDNKPL